MSTSLKGLSVNHESDVTWIHGFLGFWLVSMVFQVSFMVFHGFWLVSIVFQGGFMVFHGFWLVSMVFSRWFMVYHGLWLGTGADNQNGNLGWHLPLGVRPPPP